MLKVLCVAIQYPGRNGSPVTCSMPSPHRHADLIRSLGGMGMDLAHNGRYGFLLSDGRFADRYEAAQVALDAKQITRPVTELKSEDIFRE